MHLGPCLFANSPPRPAGLEISTDSRFRKRTNRADLTSLVSVMRFRYWHVLPREEERRSSAGQPPVDKFQSILSFHKRPHSPPTELPVPLVASSCGKGLSSRLCIMMMTSSVFHAIFPMTL
jgi:hypothetical protein